MEENKEQAVNATPHYKDSDFEAVVQELQPQLLNAGVDTGDPLFTEPGATSTEPQPGAAMTPPAPPNAMPAGTEGAELPIYGLPKMVQEYIQEVSNVYLCPMQWVTVTVFSAASTAVGSTVTIRNKYENSLSLWFVIVGKSGTNKSAPVKEVLKPLKALQRKYDKDFEECCNTPSVEGGGTATPKTQPRKRIMFNDSTPEMRAQVMQENPHGVLMYRDEIRGFFEDIGRYNKSGEASDLLRIWDNDRLDLARKTQDDIVVDRPFMNVLGSIQPKVMKRVFGNDMFMNDGLNQRIMFSYPPHVELFDPNDAEVQSCVREKWARTVQYLLEFKPNDNMRLSVGANVVYQDYLHHTIEKMRVTDDDYISAIYSKAQIQVLRLAGIVQCMWEAIERHEINRNESMGADWSSYCESLGEISAATMQYAIACMEYFEESAIRVYNAIADPGTGAPPSVAELIKGANSKDLIKEVVRRYQPTMKSISALAEALGVSQPYLSKILKS